LDDVQQRVLWRVLRRTDADADMTDVLRQLNDRRELASTDELHAEESIAFGITCGAAATCVSEN